MDNQSKAHILKALQTANDLIGLVNNSYALRNDKVCWNDPQKLYHCGLEGIR